jgi:NAD(P)-dependent dehydrogenase (short-subunit alcohol dehydrogenase family)
MKNIIITGATGSLGRSVTREFLKGDYHLNLPVRGPLVSSEKQTAWYADLTDAAAVDKMISSVAEAQGVIDAAIHLVGGYKPGALDETGTADVTAMINLNFNSAFNLVQSLLPHYQKNGKGVFIFIGASSAMNTASAGYHVAYALSKRLLVSLAEMINASNHNTQIAAHILLPSTLDTPLNRSLMPDADFSAWTPTEKLADVMRQIVEGDEKSLVIHF